MQLQLNVNPAPWQSLDTIWIRDGLTTVGTMTTRHSGKKEGAVPSDGQNHQLVLTLSSSGKTAVWRGSSLCLGQYLYHGDHNQAPSYHQRHTIKGTKSLYLFKSTDGSWNISSELGNLRMLMYSTSKTPAVPTTDWFGVSDREWHHDPALTVSPGIKSPCKSIVVMFSGILNASKECDGEYVPTSQWCRGCPVYKHTHRPLFLSKSIGWSITSGSASGIVYIENEVGGLCPAKGSWMYPIKLQCEVHDTQ